MEDCSFCANCQKKQVTGIDKDLPGYIIKEEIAKCWKAKLAFLPIDFSTELWKSWVKRLKVCVRLKTERQLDSEETVYSVSDSGENIIHRTGTGLKNIMDDLSDLSYIVTTSGTSNSQPKLVYVTRSSVQPNIDDFIDLLNITERSVLYCSSALTFDPAILTILIGIETGCNVVITQPTVGTEVLLETFRENRITHIQTVPSFLRYVGLHSLREKVFTDDTSVKFLCVGGEACLTGEELYEMFGGSETVIERVGVYNLYGLTEQSVWSSVYKIPSLYIKQRSKATVPIGEPLRHTKFGLKGADEKNEGMELIVGSDTRQCYIDDGSGQVSNSLSYHTGDVVKRTERGYVFMGRKDTDFVKIHGHRVNLSLLNKIVGEMTSVRQVFSCYDSMRGLMLAYAGDCHNKTAIMKHVQEKLTAACIPNLVIKLEQFPTNSHGKLDRWNLEKIMKSYHSNSGEGSIMDLIKGIFPADYDMDRTFIENGGTSIQALSVVSQLELEYAHLPSEDLLRAVFDKTLREIQALVTRASNIQRHKGGASRLTHDRVPKTPKLCNGFSLLKYGDIQSVIQRGDCDLKQIRRDIDLVSDMVFRWSVDTGRCVDASPVVVNYRLSDGRVMWETSLGGRIEATAAVSTKFNLVIVGCYDNDIYFLSLPTGEVQYRHRTGDIIKCSPVVEEDRAYCGSHDQNIYCYNLNKLSLVWSSKLDGAVYSTPTIYCSSLYVSTLAGSIFSLDKVTGDIQEKITLTSHIFSSLCVTDVGVVVCCVDGVSTCRSHRQLQEVVWSFKAGGHIFSTPICVNGSVIFGCHDSHLYCLDSQTGHQLWRQRLDSTIGCTPFPYKAADESLMVIVASSKGTVYSICIADGTVTGHMTLPGEVFGSQVMTQNGEIVSGCRDDKVYCISSETQNGEIVSGCRDDKVYCISTGGLRNNITK